MRNYLAISGTLFGLIALGHLLRLLLHWPAEINGHIVPAWISAVGLIVAASLGLWAVRLMRGLRPAT